MGCEKKDQSDALPYPHYSPLWNRPTSATAEAVLGWRFAGLESLWCAATAVASHPCYNAGENHPHAGSFWRMPERAVVRAGQRVRLVFFLTPHSDGLGRWRLPRISELSRPRGW